MDGHYVTASFRQINEHNLYKTHPIDSDMNNRVMAVKALGININDGTMKITTN